MSKKNKLIGIVGQVGSENFFAQKAYINHFKWFGNVVVIHPKQDEIIPNLDLLVLPGGADVSPLRYAQIPDPELCFQPNPWFEWFDMAVLPKYIENKTPIYAICRGFQSLNVHFGGTLHQHIYDHPYSGSERDKLVHSVRDLETKRVFKVNSLHHQAIDKLAPGLVPILVGNESKGENYIESFRHETLPIYGEQFHPEELDHEYSNNILKGILDGTYFKQ